MYCKHDHKLLINVILIHFHSQKKFHIELIKEILADLFEVKKLEYAVNIEEYFLVFAF